MDTTQRLADYLVGSRLEDIPAEVVREAKRSILNIVGCALGGAMHPAMEIAIATLGPYAGRPSAQVLGRGERFDPLLVSLLNGIGTHVEDYDDTMPGNYIHPSSPVASALFAYASANAVSGRDFLHAFILGVEVIARIGDATYPSYYAAGWHSTGSIGVFGAAAAIGRLLDLSPQRMTWALGMAATQSAGLREMFGSMAKAMHPGRSAQSGYISALLAGNDFTAGLHGLEGPRGFAAVQSPAYDLDRITARFGEDFGLLRNTYKPYPCGIVVHPTIDACIQLRDRHGLRPGAIESVELHVAPLVKDLCNKRELSTALESKFSIYHAAALGLGRGKAGIEDFGDDALADPVLRRLRDATQAVVDARIGEDAVRVKVLLIDGRTVEMLLAQSIGNLARPLSDRQLEQKFRDQSAVIAPAQAEAAIEACWNIDRLERVDSLIAHCVPAGD